MFSKSFLLKCVVLKVYGGSVLSINISWFQQLLYMDGYFSLNVPFTFPEYVMPFTKRFRTREKIKLNVNTGIGMEVICNAISHPLKVDPYIFVQLSLESSSFLLMSLFLFYFIQLTWLLF